MNLFSRTGAAMLLLAAAMCGAQAHEGSHLHPHVVADTAAQPLHPALVLALVAALWRMGLFATEAAGRALRRRRG
ncbi:hypothetical protein [Methylocystis echinoides]|uniref:hypothetical protein n=1 Tax=Methylocystis echinoides TaxID=29468 RepID=UPI00341BF5D8